MLTCLLSTPVLAASDASFDTGFLLTAALLITLVILLCLVVYLWHRHRRIEPERDRLVSIIESSDNAIIGKDLHGIIQSWNKGAERLYGYTREEAIGHSIKFIAPEERFGEIDEFLNKIANGGHVEHFETVRVHKDGHLIPVSLSISPIYGRQGEIVGASAIVRDISQRRRMEQRLEQGAEVVRIVMESLPVGVLVVDEDGMITYANPGAAGMFGYSDSLVGRQLEKLLPARFRGHHAALRQEYLDAPTARDMGKGRDLNGLRRDGREFPVEIALAPLPMNDGKRRVMAAVIDITARKRYEQALEYRTRQLERSNKELDSFAYVASHDLRSPLRGIDNLCVWIEEDLGEDVPEEVQEHLELLRGRISRMEGMLEDLLEYSRVGRGKEHPEKVDVRELIENTVDLLAPPDGFEVRFEGELPVFETLETPLAQVFRNLINNAIKHHDRESGTIVVGVRELDDWYEFSVSDDGPGIEPRYRERIFRMFSTLRPRDEVEGSGLGLAMISKIVETWHGNVWVEDAEQGRGSVFRFTWPKVIRLNNASDVQELLVKEG